MRWVCEIKLQKMHRGHYVSSVHVCVLSRFSRVRLCDPRDCSPTGFCVHGALQARILEWFAIPFSKGSSLPRDRTCVSCTGRQVLYPGSPKFPLLNANEGSWNMVVLWRAPATEPARAAASMNGILTKPSMPTLPMNWGNILFQLKKKSTNQRCRPEHKPLATQLAAKSPGQQMICVTH